MSKSNLVALLSITFCLAEMHFYTTVATAAMISRCHISVHLAMKCRYYGRQSRYNYIYIPVPYHHGIDKDNYPQIILNE